MMQTEKPQPPSYNVAVECLEGKENISTTTTMKIDENLIGKVLC